MSILRPNAAISGREGESLLGRLKDAQRKFGYVPEEVMADLARSCGLPVGELYGMTTFYSFLSTRPLGKHAIRICRSIPCWLKDAEMIIEAVGREVGIAPGQTTPDKKFSFQLTNCIGACDMAPAMMVDDRVYGLLTPGKIAEILKTFE